MPDFIPPFGADDDDPMMDLARQFMPDDLFYSLRDDYLSKLREILASGVDKIEPILLFTVVSEDGGMHDGLIGFHLDEGSSVNDKLLERAGNKATLETKMPPAVVFLISRLHMQTQDGEFNLLMGQIEGMDYQVVSILGCMVDGRQCGAVLLCEKDDEGNLKELTAELIDIHHPSLRSGVVLGPFFHGAALAVAELAKDPTTNPLLRQIMHDFDSGIEKNLGPNRVIWMRKDQE